MNEGNHTDEKASPDPIWKFIGGLLLGVGLTVLYVRFGWTLPICLQLGPKINTAAVSMTADIDLYNPQAPLETRRRALAVLAGQNPKWFLEIEKAAGMPIYAEALRQRAVRDAKHLKHRFDAYDHALKRAALREALERRHGKGDDLALKRRMLMADIRKEGFLYDYLQDRFPSENLEQLADRVLDVYKSGFEEDVIAAQEQSTTRR